MNTTNVNQAQETLHYCPDELLDLVCQQSSVINRTLAHHGSHTVADYLDRAVQTVDKPYQSRDDLLDVVYRYAAPLLGSESAERACADLRESPSVLTTNHHGVDFFAQSVQGSLIFSQRKVNGNPARTVPVFACGNVPLDSLTYPMGALIYDTGHSNFTATPVKIPIFPRRLRHSLVSTATAINSEMISNAQKRLARIRQDNQFESGAMRALCNILEQDYGSAEVLHADCYSDQSVMLNQKIWKRMFRKSVDSPDMVYLDAERITASLLERDLFDEKSLAYIVMFDAAIRQKLNRELDGQAVCWTQKKLTTRLWPEYFLKNSKPSITGGGTFMFWGINDAGRRVPLGLAYDEEANLVLHGIDDSGSYHSYSFNRDAIVRALRNNTLLPSVFTCFLVLSFARGVTCFGGYYQAEYLPAIQHGLINALRLSPQYKRIADLVSQVPSASYLAGAQTVMCKTAGNSVIPAGPLEIIAGGGLSAVDIERLNTATIRETHLAGLADTLFDIKPRGLDFSGSKTGPALEYGSGLGENIIILNAAPG